MRGSFTWQDAYGCLLLIEEPENVILIYLPSVGIVYPGCPSSSQTRSPLVKATTNLFRYTNKNESGKRKNYIINTVYSKVYFRNVSIVHEEQRTHHSLRCLLLTW